MAQAQSDSETPLTCTDTNGTLSVQVDSTTQKLLKRLLEIERQTAMLRHERDAITTALSVAGIRPPDAAAQILDFKESAYLRDQPFKDTPLTDACLTVLRDYAGKWLTSSQVEYLVSRGGYKFSTRDSQNSVSVTLRRLVGQHGVAAKRARGAKGNQYAWIKAKEEGEGNAAT